MPREPTASGVTLSSGVFWPLSTNSVVLHSASFTRALAGLLASFVRYTRYEVAPGTLSHEMRTVPSSPMSGITTETTPLGRDSPEGLALSVAEKSAETA